jgi:hypothetical protein
MAEKYRYGEYSYEQGDNYTATAPRGSNTVNERPGGYDDEDVFGHEEGHDVRLLQWGIKQGHACLITRLDQV